MIKWIYVLFSICCFLLLDSSWALDSTPPADHTSSENLKKNSELLKNSTINQVSSEVSTSPPTTLPPLATFRSLDEETELLVKEVLDLSSDLAIIEEEEDNPSNHQLMVLVTLDPTELFTLDYMQLEIDNEVVAAYQYSEQDIQALKRGGGHRLYLANLPAGMHEVYVVMMGRIPRDPDYKKEVNYKFISGVSRTVLELNVDSKAKGFPILAIKEWN